MAFAPLNDICVLDLTSVVVGPAATWRLGQYGDEIIKLESSQGDLMRGLGGLSPTGQYSGAYLHLNSGKEKICLDLKSPAAHAVVDRLVASADVIVANMRPDALALLTLDAASITARHPDKVYCLISGYGTDGPYAGQPTYDSVVQGATGMAGLMLVRDGAPAYVPMLICDHVVGEIAAGAILAALMQRRATGRGASIEIPMLETMAAFVLQEHLAQASFVPPVGSVGDQRLLSAHNKPVQTANGWISFTINTDPQVRAFLTAVGRGDLLGDPRFDTVAARAKNVSEWFAVRGAPLTGRTTADWLDIFRAADIAAMPCHTLETLPDDPHLKAVGLLVRTTHPTEGETVAIRSSISVDGSHADVRSPAQAKGWDTREILHDLGYGAAEITALIADGTAHGPSLGLA